MTLVVLAAGMGSRYGGLKQIDPITSHGEFIIDFSVYDAIDAGFDKVVFIIKEENLEDFKETIGSRISSQVKVEYAFQAVDRFIPADAIPEGRTRPWGTAHAVLCAKAGDFPVFSFLLTVIFFNRITKAMLIGFLQRLLFVGNIQLYSVLIYVIRNKFPIVVIYRTFSFNHRNTCLFSHNFRPSFLLLFPKVTQYYF